MSGLVCPKCGARSGDDWSHCKGYCPMGSPYNKPEEADNWESMWSSRHKDEDNKEVDNWESPWSSRYKNGGW